jgi:hypothetical protein
LNGSNLVTVAPTAARFLRMQTRYLQFSGMRRSRNDFLAAMPYDNTKPASNTQTGIVPFAKGVHHKSDAIL